MRTIARPLQECDMLLAMLHSTLKQELCMLAGDVILMRKEDVALEQYSMPELYPAKPWKTTEQSSIAMC